MQNPSSTSLRVHWLVAIGGHATIASYCVCVNYDSFLIDAAVADTYAAMVR
jgi:hypothetical protein